MTNTFWLGSRSNFFKYLLVVALVIVSPLLLRASTLQQQVPSGKVVKGVVKTIGSDGKMEPVPGASVAEKGTGNGTTTNGEGQFTITVKENAVLAVSSIGLVSKEISVSKVTSGVIISLDRSARNLREVEVVSNGFQTINRRLFTGSAAKLKGSDAKNQGETDISRMLQGKVAGVSVQNVSGTFGAAPRIRIRGATSLTGDNKPLFVVDGIVLEDVVNVTASQLTTGDPATLLGSSVAGLNADDIQDIQILKDAAATGLYGARAANGVVVITTKRGRVGKTVVSYTGNFSVRLKPSYNQFDIMNSSQQLSVYSELYRKGWLNQSAVVNGADGGIYNKMYQLINHPLADGTFAVENTPAGREKYLRQFATTNTNWFNELFTLRPVQEHAISVSAGNEAAQYYFSTNIYNDPGWTLADKVQRYTANMKATYKFSKKLTFDVNTVGSVRFQRVPGSVPRTPDPVNGGYSRQFDINPYNYALSTSRTIPVYDPSGGYFYYRHNYADFNELNEIGNNYNNIRQVDVKLQGNLKYSITKHFDFSILGALRYVKSSNEYNATENSNVANAYRADQNGIISSNNRLLYTDPNYPNSLPAIILPQGGLYDRTEDQLVSYNIRAQQEYNKTFEGDHIVNVLVGEEARSADRQNAFNNGYGYQFNKGGIAFTDYRIIKKLIESGNGYFGSTKTFDRFVAAFATASYSYKGKYTINLTGRYDGTNQLGKNAQFLPTYNVSSSWDIKSEDFLKDINFVSNLRVRATYGLTATFGNATNSQLVLRNQITPRPYSTETESSIYIQDLANNNLTWEKSYDKNIGLDAGFFQNRLNLNLDYYSRNGFDLIDLVRTSGVGGQYTKFANNADLASHGVELTLSGNAIKLKDFSWESTFVFGYNKNKITRAQSTPIIFDLIGPTGGIKQGYAQAGLFSIPFVGLDPNNGIPNFINETGVVSHNVNLQSVSTRYLKYEGTADPTITGGFTNSFHYKNLTFTVLLTYQAGNKVRLDPRFADQYSDLSSSPTEFFSRWEIPGDEKKTNIPSIVDYKTFPILQGYSPNNYYNYSSARIADGYFIRVKNASFTYAFPKSWVKGIGANNLSLSLVGNDILLILSDKRLHGQDPEFFNSGGVASPIPRQFTMSLKLVY